MADTENGGELLLVFYYLCVLSLRCAMVPVAPVPYRRSVCTCGACVSLRAEILQVIDGVNLIARVGLM